MTTDMNVIFRYKVLFILLLVQMQTNAQVDVLKDSNDPINNPNFYYRITLDDDVEGLSCFDNESARLFYHFRDTMPYTRYIDFQNDSTFIMMDFDVDQDEWTDADSQEFIDKFNEDNREWLEHVTNKEIESRKNQEVTISMGGGNRPNFEETAKVNLASFLTRMDQKIGGICINNCYPIDNCEQIEELVELQNGNISLQFVIDKIEFYDEWEINEVFAILRLSLIYSGNILFTIGCHCEEYLNRLYEAENTYSMPPSDPKDNLWAAIDLTSPQVKKDKKGFPWLWVLIPAAATTAAVLIVTSDDDEPDPIPTCNIDADISTTPSDCGQSNGQIIINGLPPDADYTITVDNVTVENNIIARPQGTYDVVITDNSIVDCSETFTATVDERPLNLDLTIETSPGSCFESGEAVLSIIGDQTPSEEITLGLKLQSSLSDNGMPLWEASTTFDHLTGGTTNIDLVSIIKESTSFEPVIDSIIGELTIVGSEKACTQTFSFFIPEDSVDLQANDLMFTGLVNTPFSGNLLDNDIGIGLTLIDVSPIIGAGLEVSPQGDFTFVALQEGTFEVIYTIRDTCQREDQAVVVFIITDIDPCNINAEVSTTPADCGTNNGTANITLTAPDVENPIWSADGDWVAEGENNLINNNIEAGTYTITIVENQTGCTLDVTFTIDQLGPENLLDLSTTPGSCFESGDISLTLSDTHSNYTLCLFDQEQLPLGEWEVTPGNVLVSEFTDLHPAIYTITIKPMNTAEECFEEATVTIEEEDVPLIANDIIVTINTGDIWTGNILDNDEGVGLTVINIETDDDLAINFLPNGNSSWGPSAVPRVHNSIYTVRDTCDRTATANIIITVTGETPCDIDVSIETFPAVCGIDNGSATVVLSFSSIDDPNWSLDDGWVQEGDNTFVNNNLPKGVTELVVTELTTNCELPVTLEIDQQPIDLISNIETVHSTCLFDGNIIVTTTAPYPSLPTATIILYKDDMEVLNISVPWGLVELNNFIAIDPGTYLVEVKGTGQPDDCKDAETAIVEPTDFFMLLQDDFAEIEFGEAWTGNVLDNDQGNSIQVISITQPTGGTLDISPTGEATFIPDDGFFGETTATYTVQDICGQMASANIFIVVNEPPCTFIDDFSVIPATCNDQGDVLYQLTLPDNNELLVIITYPDMSVIEFVLTAETLLLSDLGPVSPGTYTVTFINPDISDDCSESVTVEVPEYTPPLLELIEQTPPSTPDSDDGTVTFSISGQSPPYILLMNDMEFGPFGNETFTISGLTEGEYEVIAIDSEGCPSNFLFILLIADALFPPHTWTLHQHLMPSQTLQPDLTNSTYEGHTNSSLQMPPVSIMISAGLQMRWGSIGLFYSDMRYSLYSGSHQALQQGRISQYGMTVSTRFSVGRTTWDLLGGVGVHEWRSIDFSGALPAYNTEHSPLIYFYPGILLPIKNADLKGGILSQTIGQQAIITPTISLHHRW